MIDEPQLIDTMLKDLARQRDIYQPGPYWQKYAHRIAQAIRSEGLAQFRASPRIGRGFVDVFPGDRVSRMVPDWRTTLIESLLKLPLAERLHERHKRRVDDRFREAHQKKQDRYSIALGHWFSGFVSDHGIPDTTVGQPQRKLRFADVEIGELYLRTFGWISDCSRHVDLTQVRTVFEIGGGFGAMAHTLLHLFPNIRKYLYLDIPPVLYVGTQYLKHFYGDSVIDYRSTRDLEKLMFSSNDDREILAVCPWQIEKVEASCDFFWNSSSFQEMPGAIVSNYASHIERLLLDPAHLAFYVYEGGDAARTLVRHKVLGAFEGTTKFQIEPVEAGISNKILPGTLFIGGR